MRAGAAGGSGAAQAGLTHSVLQDVSLQWHIGPWPAIPQSTGQWGQVQGDPPQLSLCHAPTSTWACWVVGGPGAVALSEGSWAVTGLWGLSVPTGAPWPRWTRTSVASSLSAWLGGFFLVLPTPQS